MVPRMRGKNEDKANDNKGRGTVKSNNNNKSHEGKRGQCGNSISGEGERRRRGKCSLDTARTGMMNTQGRKMTWWKTQKKSSRKGPRVRVAEKEKVESSV